VLCAGVAGVWFYLNPPMRLLPQVLGSDRASVLGAALILSSDFVLCPADCPDGSVLSIGHGDPIPLTKVRSKDFAGTTLTLMRAQTPVSSDLVSSVADVQSGLRLNTRTADAWEGSLLEQAGTWVAQPALP